MFKTGKAIEAQQNFIEVPSKELEYLGILMILVPVYLGAMMWLYTFLSAKSTEETPSCYSLAALLFLGGVLGALGKLTVDMAERKARTGTIFKEQQITTLPAYGNMEKREVNSPIEANKILPKLKLH